jgi:hypothetical protein
VSRQQMTFRMDEDVRVELLREKNKSEVINQALRDHFAIAAEPKLDMSAVLQVFVSNIDTPGEMYPVRVGIAIKKLMEQGK